MSFNKLFLFSVVDCCSWDSDLFGWSGLLLGGLTSATTSTISFSGIFFLIPIKQELQELMLSASTG